MYVPQEVKESGKTERCFKFHDLSATNPKRDACKRIEFRALEMSMCYSKYYFSNRHEFLLYIALYTLSDVSLLLASLVYRLISR